MQRKQDGSKQPEPASPRVLISYSHDSEDHVRRVLELANQLRQDGIDCRIDQFEPHPPQGWPRWMEEQIALADFVLIVCTQRYADRFNGTNGSAGRSGVGWESLLIHNELYDNPFGNSKFIPVGFDADFEHHIPQPLRGVTHYLLDDLVLDSGIDYHRLYRVLTNQPEAIAASLGPVTRLKPLVRRDRVSDLVTIQHGSQLLLASLSSGAESTPPRLSALYALRFLGFDRRHRQIRDFINANEHWLFENTPESVKDRVKHDFSFTTLQGTQPAGFALAVSSPLINGGLKDLTPGERLPFICVSGEDELQQFLTSRSLYGKDSRLRKFARIRYVFIEEPEERRNRQTSAIVRLLSESSVSTATKPGCVLWGTASGNPGYRTHRSPQSPDSLIDESETPPDS